MNFDGWYHNESKNVWTRELVDGGRAIVGRFDGWNWGFLVTDRDGSILTGRLHSSIDLNEAIEAANAAI